MEPDPSSSIEGLLQSAYAWLRKHNDGVRLTYRIGLIAVSAVLGYLGYDVPDIPDDDIEPPSL
jgi:hypothetical protein